MTIVLLAQIVIGILLTAVVLMQSSSGGLGSFMGGSSGYHTKRGIEKGMFYLTIALGVLFTGISIIVLTL